MLYPKLSPLLYKELRGKTMNFLKHFFARIIVLFCWGLLYALTFILLVWGLLDIDPFTTIEMMKKNVPQRREKIEAFYHKVSNKDLPAVPEKQPVPSAGIAVSVEEEMPEPAQPVPSELVPPAVNPQTEPAVAPENVLNATAEEATEQIVEVQTEQIIEPPTEIQTQMPVPVAVSSVINVSTEDMAFDEEQTGMAENTPVAQENEDTPVVQPLAENVTEAEPEAVFDEDDNFILPSQDLQLQE